ncbi:putative RNA helicase [Plasmodium gaboni]|uniref:RNA helicase n=1 Tax=Plasmodium gaboni TaxID=647221 RepID=A0A151LL13_9APIC|nr:putative RNA helicase [Plasmodium gaboni]KYN99596.1 putative RNA helicase [Plasmodium gaboni]
MDVIKELTYGLNLKSSLKNGDLMSLKEENLKPLKNILNIKKENESNEDEKKKKLLQSCEGIKYSQFYENANMINSYMKINEINVEYENINRNIVPIRFFHDIIEYLKIINNQRDDEKEHDKMSNINKLNHQIKPYSDGDDNKDNKEEDMEQNKLNTRTNEEEEIKNNDKSNNKGYIINKEYEKLLSTIKNTLYFKRPTCIQKMCIPSILNDYNTICISQTGSGKTCSFLIPLLIKLNNIYLEEHEKKNKINKINNNNNSNNNNLENICVKNNLNENFIFIKSLIIVPTNELACQIYEQALLLFESYKHINIIHLNKLNDIIENNVIDICVCTPMILLNMIHEKEEKDEKKKKKVSLKKCFFIVFDEVDKLFEIKFLEQVNTLLKEIQNKKIQKIFTTATLPGNIKNFISTLCPNYTVVYFGKNINTINNNIKQELLYVNNEEEKLLVLNNLIKNKEIHIPVLIFVDSIIKANMIYTNLHKSVSYIALLTSEKPKDERKNIFEKFQQGHIWYLICTDILSRGIDIKGIETVINYDVCYDKYNYMHRIGRACRSDRKEGKAITFFTSENIKYMKDIIKFVKNSGTHIPSYLENFQFKKTPKLHFSKFNKNSKKNKKKNKIKSNNNNNNNNNNNKGTKKFIKRGIIKKSKEKTKNKINKNKK